MSSPKPRSTYTPPPQAELKPTPILEDAEPESALTKKRSNRQTLRASFLTAPAQTVGSGVNLG